MAVHTQNTGKEHPTALVANHTEVGSEVEVVPREVDTGTEGAREVEGVGQRDGSNLKRAVGYSCSHKTCKSAAFRMMSESQIVGGRTRLCS